MVWVRFENSHTGKDEIYGPYNFIQVTYNWLRYGPEGLTLANLGDDDEWKTMDGESWTDFVVHSER